LCDKADSQIKVDSSKLTTQTEMNVSMENQYTEIDKKLNDLYQKVLSKLNSKKKLTLIRAQRTWIVFRDQYSKIYELLYEGGSMAGSAVLKCKIELTGTRIKELQILFDQLNM
jgi:uncharacterized protein YecT (DUF1311 family)